MYPQLHLGTIGNLSHTHKRHMALASNTVKPSSASALHVESTNKFWPDFQEPRPHSRSCVLRAIYMRFGSASGQQVYFALPPHAFLPGVGGQAERIWACFRAHVRIMRWPTVKTNTMAHTLPPQVCRSCKRRSCACVSPALDAFLRGEGGRGKVGLVTLLFTCTALLALQRQLEQSFEARLTQPVGCLCVEKNMAWILHDARTQ